ncbi:MAG: cytochrome P450 [Chloroflexota bacterium]|nr:cytochrome P450 [Chloroflexota bacterium]
MRAFPADPIAAVTHPDPYPYYADLVARRPLYRDDALGLWVTSSADAVTAVLTSDLCRVRPPTEPIPEALRGSPAGTIFGHLVRFNDGAGHCPFKDAVSAALASIATSRVAARSAAWARSLSDEIEPTRDPGRLSRFAFHLPISVAASLLGIPDALLPRTAAWAGDFARCLAPGSGPEEVARGTVAAGNLLALFNDLVPTLRDESDDTLLTLLAREARHIGRDDAAIIVANGIGFLFQAYDATAGLIGNTLLALASHPDVQTRLVADPGLLDDVIEEVLRCDPPVQNTRRFVAGDGALAGREMHEGDGILVVLAAAGRDPSANPHPEQFDISRKDRRLFTFGAGVHACPGAPLATTIARAGIAQLLASGADLERLTQPVIYRPSHNVRIALAPMEGT